MTMITESVPGGFSHDRHPVADAPRPPDSAGGCAAPFLAPPTAEAETPVPRASDCGELAMNRLRNPFTVAEG